MRDDSYRYGGMIFLILVTTWDEKSARSKSWSFAVLFIMLVYEVLIKYDDEDWDYLVGVLPYTSVHQKVELLHLVCMYAFHLLAQYASATYIDMADARYKDLRMRIDVLSDQLSELSDGVEALMSKYVTIPKEIPVYSTRGHGVGIYLTREKEGCTGKGVVLSSVSPRGW